jgi:beta-lactam-binding protein with PASTA domain
VGRPGHRHLARATGRGRVGIQPYEDLETKVRPERRSGRRKARYDIVIRNKANAPADIVVAARDLEGACRTKLTPAELTIAPGEEAKVALEVRPPRQQLIGRPTERRLEVLAAGGEEGARLAAERDAEVGAGGGDAKGLAKKLGIKAPQASISARGVQMRGPTGPRMAPAKGKIDLNSLKAAGAVAPAAPLLPNQIAYRQKPWLPWWLAIVVPLLAVVLIGLLLSQPKTTKVPSVIGAKSVFEAQKKLEAAGLTLNPATQQKPSTEVAPGAVLGQTPAAGESVTKGAPVAVLVAVGTGSVKVPSIVGQKLGDADASLRKVGLAVGKSSVTPPDLKAAIKSQIPAAGEVVKVGSPVDIYYALPKKAKGKQKQAKKGPVTLPAITSKDPSVVATALAAAGAVPATVSQFSDAKPGEVIGTDPAPGAKLAQGASVKVLVSAGFPQLAYDNGTDVLLADGASGKKLAPIAKTAGREKDPTWSADGTHVAYTVDNQLMLVDTTKAGSPPTPMNQDGVKYADPSFAPTPEAQVLAATRLNNGNRQDTDLCVGQITSDGWQPSCISDPKSNPGMAHWAPDGKSILVAASSNRGFGIVRYTSSVPFSPRQDDWGAGRFITPRDPAGQKGVIDEAISPDGKHVAAVANLDSPDFRLYLTVPGDLRLTKAKALPVQACKIAWRADSQEIVIVQAGAACGEDTGQLSRIDLADPTTAKALSADGDNPAFQPLVVGK